MRTGLSFLNRQKRPLFVALMEKNRQYRALFGKEVHLISAPAIPVSSTDIRAALRRGIAPATLPERVFTYIRERGLYQYGTERSGS